MEDKQRNFIIATNIKKYLKESNITQKKLAEEIGISPSTMSDYMNLRSNPSHGVIQRIADYFKIKKSDIDTTYKENSDPSSIESIYSILEPERQKIVYDTAKEQLAQQNKASNNVVNINKKKYDTLAAHSPDPDKVFTDKEKLKINQFLDKVDADYDRKQKECKHLFDDESDDKE
ncbi:helix-turn-helix domain-containing protein [Enterococcus faecalis]|uniref:helix-turn-helix domain-containing protein n=1 Tax=Enterococcus faecalis TaxID=1351 RepID=UPI000CF22613|nr:helix-turn-helix transcriptional regulator [Enterococcus faecalis]EJZ8456829.1 helix-turn-helix transcriptional regulator [Enterococcus faecalis]PQF13699.1 transcriptional regulator [Enterococcus faecalis]